MSRKVPAGAATMLGGVRVTPEETEVFEDVDLGEIVSPTSKVGRTTVLPRRAGRKRAFATELEPRFQHMKVLGADRRCRRRGRVEVTRSEPWER